MQKAYFGAGCFWGVESAFRVLDGVVATAVGYQGGSTKSPAYEDVCTDTTGHAEVVEVEFDTEKISYRELLDVFWDNHDPTTLNRQGPDFGSQYRSVIFYTNDAQAATAQGSKERLEASGRFKKKIVTEILSAPPFYRAEEYHQQYLEKRGQAHCKV